MRQNTFQQHVTTGRLTLPVALLILLGGWVLSLYYPFATSIPENGSPIWNKLADYLPKELPLSLGINLITYLLIGFLLIPFNNAIAVIRTRASIQTSLFFVWSAFLPVIHPLQSDTFTTILLLASLVCFMSGYQHPRPMPYIYHAWLLLGIASWLAPEVLLLIPVYIIGAYQFHILSLKSFIAGILGVLFSYLIFCILIGSMQQIPLIIAQLDTFRQLFTTYSPPHHERWMIVLMIFHATLLFVALFHYWIKNAQLKIKTRDFMNFFLTAELFLQVIIYLKPETLHTLLPISLICLSLIEGHFFTTVQNKITNLLLILTFITTIILYGLILWKV